MIDNVDTSVGWAIGFADEDRVMKVVVKLSDQVKNFVWHARRATRKGKVTDSELRQVRAKLRALIVA